MFEFISSILPWFILCAGILLTMLVSIIRVNTKRPAQIFALLTLFGALVTALGRISNSAFSLAGCMEISPFTHLFLILFCAIGILFILGTSRYLTQEQLHYSDYYHLLLILILGATVMVSAKDLIVVFIALEVMSLPAYTLAGFRRNDPRSNEAAIKYYILGGALGAVYLLGSSFLFGATGSLKFIDIYAWTQVSHSDLLVFYIGHALVLMAFLFKVAAVPFHFWKPDVYEGSPIPVAGIMATVVTAAAFITLTRLIHLVDFNRTDWANYAEVLRGFLRYLAGASLIVGSAIMITQSNMKRMLAYSSISHTGYLLLGVLGTLFHEEQIASILFYLVGYCLMSSGLFILLSQSETKADMGTELVDLTGLMKRSPYTSFLWIVFLFSMVGMPFTVGFFGKYFVFISSISANEAPLVVVAALCTVVSAYAYLRPVALMVMRDADPSASYFRGTWIGNSMVLAAALTVIFLGTLPNSMITLLKGIPLIH